MMKMEDELEASDSLQERMSNYSVEEYRAFVDGLAVASNSIADVVNRLEAQLLLMQAVADGRPTGGGDA